MLKELLAELDAVTAEAKALLADAKTAADVENAKNKPAKARHHLKMPRLNFITE